MKRFLLSFFCLALCTSAFPQETQESCRSRRGEGCLFAYRDATTLSIVGWGFGIAIGIGALCALIDNESGTTAH